MSWRRGLELLALLVSTVLALPLIAFGFLVPFLGGRVEPILLLAPGGLLGLLALWTALLKRRPSREWARVLLLGIGVGVASGVAMAALVLSDPPARQLGGWSTYWGLTLLPPLALAASRLPALWKRARRQRG